MTQTVDSKWTDDVEVRTLNFLDVVDPPKNPNKDEFFSQLQRFAECVAPGIQPENDIAPIIQRANQLLKNQQKPVGPTNPFLRKKP